MTKVKICGITNIDDALLAVRSGADMLGFNFYAKSPRYIEPIRAAEMISTLPMNVMSIGVFVNENIERVVETATSLRLNAVQLHGDETPGYVDELDGIKVIKAFRISEDFNENRLDEFDVDSILVDAFSDADYGGTGETCDWTAARRISERFPKMFLSGGLSAENVKSAIQTVRPYAVDACSRLEIVKGLKDPEKLERFIKAAKGTI